MNCFLLLNSSLLLILLLLHVPAKPVMAMSECLALNEELSKFHCFTSKVKQKCEDTDQRCAEWGKRGECSSNPQYMLNYCAKSCESCISGHAGTTQVAPKGANIAAIRARMEETRQYLREQAEFKAKILRQCLNLESKCTHWAVMGECDKNPNFMFKHCGPACLACKV